MTKIINKVDAAINTGYQNYDLALCLRKSLKRSFINKTKWNVVVTRLTWMNNGGHGDTFVDEKHCCHYSRPRSRYDCVSIRRGQWLFVIFYKR